MCACMNVCMCICVPMYVEAGVISDSLFNHSPLSPFWERVSHYPASAPGVPVLGLKACVSVFKKNCSMWLLEIGTQVLVLGQQPFTDWVIAPVLLSDFWPKDFSFIFWALERGQSHTQPLGRWPLLPVPVFFPLLFTAALCTGCHCSNI